MGLFGIDVPRVVQWPLRVGEMYLIGWVFPGAWVGGISAALFGGVPDGWYFCFPDAQPAFLSGLSLVALLPLMRPPRLHPIPYAIYGMGVPLVMTLAWLAWYDPPLVNDLSLRWWVSNQVPAMLVASSLALVAAFQQIRVDDAAAGAKAA